MKRLTLWLRDAIGLLTTSDLREIEARNYWTDPLIRPMRGECRRRKIRNISYRRRRLWAAIEFCLRFRIARATHRQSKSRTHSCQMSRRTGFD